MDYIVDFLLNQATKEGWFDHIDNHRLEIYTCQNEKGNIKYFNSGLQKLSDLGEWFAYTDGKAALPPYKPPEGYELVGGVRLLIQMSRPPHVIGLPNKFPWKNEKTCRDVFHALDLHKTYVLTLDHSSGISEIIHKPLPENKGSKLYLVAQNTDYHFDSWSMAITYDPQNRITTGFFCADIKKKPEHIDPKTLINHFIASKYLSAHPMLLPTIMFRKLMESSVHHRDTLRIGIQDLEKEIGHVDVRNQEEELPPEDHEKRDKILDYRALSRRLNNTKKQQASRDGRHQFWRQYQKILDDGFRSFEANGTKNFSTTSDAHQELKHLTSFYTKRFESLEGRDLNYGARIDAQMKLLYNLIAQNDSNSQMQIANSHVQMAKSHVHIAELQAQIVNSAAKDNAQVKTLTYLGIFFLPANLIAALLGIQGYQMTGKLFLIFLAYTVPFGILVFGAFNLHMWWRKRRQTKLARREGVTPEFTFNPQQNEDIEMRDMQRRGSVAR